VHSEMANMHHKPSFPVQKVDEVRPKHHQSQSIIANSLVE
jgi:hypothetical protein